MHINLFAHHFFILFNIPIIIHFTIISFIAPWAAGLDSCQGLTPVVAAHPATAIAATDLVIKKRRVRAAIHRARLKLVLL